MAAIDKCPLCGAHGQDLVFKFYCANPFCQNFDHAAIPKKKRVTELLHAMWEVYNLGETELEFCRRFYLDGGVIELHPETPAIEHAHIKEPDWLKERMGWL